MCHLIFSVDSFPFPIIADPRREIAYMLEMLDPREIGKDGLPLTARNVFIVGPDKTIRAMIVYPANTGRSFWWFLFLKHKNQKFSEIIRCLDSLQMGDRVPTATPEGWQPSQKCMVEQYVNDEKVSQFCGPTLDFSNFDRI